ncbi:MAG TPA: hypothetical protein VK284_09535 [Streptosporangiaceae bacterium]|nr:hypothetical protein [Streptosporangiaceae bacterium]
MSMTKLHRRITSQAGQHAAAQAAYHPWGTADTPVSWPGFRITYTPAGAMFEAAHVLISANGAPVYAGIPGGPTHNGGVHLAGRL